MVKSYLRYELTRTGGLINSPASNVCWDPNANLVATPTLENITVWDLKKATPIHRLEGGKSEVTNMALSNAKNQLAAGYGDGTVRTWGMDGTTGITLHGHRSAVTALRYNQTDALLASGSKDTDVIVWDVVAEAGLYRLKGHKDGVTDLAFAGDDLLITCSKDTLVKVWQLQSQHCVQTIVGHRHQVWTLDVNHDFTRLVTGSHDAELRLFDLTNAGKPEGVLPLGSVRRQSRDRAVLVRFHPSDGEHVGCLGADKSVEIFAVRSAEEAARRLAKRIRQKKKKAEEKGEEMIEDEAVPIASVELGKVAMVAARGRVRSFSWGKQANQVLLALHDNSMAVYNVSGETGKKTSTVERQGHRSGVRSIALSSDSSHIVTCADDCAKVWAVDGLRLVQTLETPSAVCATFVVTSYNYIVVGSREGALHVCDVQAGLIIQTLDDAHTGNVWSLVCSRDGKTVVSAGSDKQVRFWKLAIGGRAETAAAKLQLVPVHSMEMADEVLATCLTRDGKLVCVAMLDSTVKVFMEESLKFFLSLYGHKLPVLCLDASDDSTLLATGSADKSVKLWGLDFGDLHKSFHAHDDSVTSVKFVPGSHYFFSTGKDKLVKYWDGDSREMVMAMPSHHAEVWSAAVSHVGDFLITCSNDRSIRYWQRTDDQVFIEEERENALDEIFDSNLDNQGHQMAIQGAMAENVESGAAARTTSETLLASERLFEALELAEEDEKRVIQHDQNVAAAKHAAKALGKEYEEPIITEPNILLLGQTGPEYLLKQLSGTTAAVLEHSLLLLPFASALYLFKHIRNWLEQRSQVELCCRTLFFVLRLHHRQVMVGQREILPELEQLTQLARSRLRERKMLMGKNFAAMQFMRQEIESTSSSAFFGNSLESRRPKKKHRVFR